MKVRLILIAGLWLGSVAASFLAGKATGSAEESGAGRQLRAVGADYARLQKPEAAVTDGAMPEPLSGESFPTGQPPKSEEEQNAFKDRIAESLRTALTTSDRMLLVTRLLSSMTPENAWLIKDGFGQSWDEGCHFHAEHDLMWSRLGEILKAEAATQLIKPEGPFWPVHGKLLEGWARSDPQGIAEWLKTIPDHAQRSSILSSVLRGLAAVAPADSLEIVLGLPEAERTAALVAAERGAGNLGGTPGANRLRDAIAELPQAEFQQVFTAAAKDNPEQAVSWADAFAKRHPLRSQEAYDTIAASWMAADPTAMSEWLNSIQNHPGSDAMTLRLVKQIAAEDPEAARAWANKIKEPALRSEALGRIK